MDLGEYLVLYYHNAFPFDLIYRFIRANHFREFAITLQNATFVRALSFTSSEEIKSMFLKRIPLKLDIGAIYDKKPETGTEMKPVYRELVFDIDLTDYSRHCCEGKTTCNDCFSLIKCAARIMDYTLTNCFGFSKILYVFSGGRGMHVWVCDESAMKLNNRERRGIVDCISVNNKQLYTAVNEILKEYINYFETTDSSEEEKFHKVFVKIDKNVTSDMKHLLKAPFAVHQSSKKISVPMSIDMIINLYIEDVPVLNDVLENVEKLQPFIDYFDRFVNRL